MTRNLLTSIALLAFLTAASGCKFLKSEDPRNGSKLECQAKALEPVVGQAYDATELVQDIQAKRTSFDAVFARLQATRSQIKAAYAALRACDAPAADAGAGE